MIKRLSARAAFLALLMFSMVGCSNDNIDTAKVRASMQSLDSSQKQELESALTAIEAKRYKDSLLPLRKVAFGAKLDKSQSKLLKDTMDKVQVHIAKGE
jgi:hypothetical protein